MLLFSVLRKLVVEIPQVLDGFTQVGGHVELLQSK